MNNHIQLPQNRTFPKDSTWIAAIFAIFLLSLGAAPYCAGQTPAVDELRQKLNEPNASVTLAMPSLRLSKMIPRGELKIENGVAKPGPFNFPLNTDRVVQRGAQLRIVKIEVASDKNNVLHVTVSDADGYSAKLGIVLPKDADVAPDESALEQALQPVLTFAAGGAVSASHTATTPPAPIPEPTPAPPVHNAKTVDFPGAADGYPPMHADNAAPDGCWYEPYHSDAMGVEFLYVQCAPGQGDVQHVSDGPKGPVGINSLGPAEFFIVHEKHAEETLQAAVRRVVIMQFRDPAARVACHVSAGHPANIVGITASGPYTRRKSYPLGKDGMPCDGYLDTDDGGTSFIALPNEDKTRFIEAPSGKAYIEYPLASVHFKSGASASAKTSNTALQPQDAQRTPRTPAKRLPVMAKIWDSQGQTAGEDLAPEAATLLTSTHGFIMGTDGSDAIAAVACDVTGGAVPHLVMHVLLKTFPGVEENAFNPTAQVNFGDVRHDVSIKGELGQQWLVVTFPLMAADIQAMDRQHLVSGATLGIIFFKGQRIIVSGTLPAANEALDTVLRACNVQTSQRAAAPTTPNLSPDAIHSLTLGKLTLGTSTEDAKRALGPGFKFMPVGNTRSPRVSYLIASDSIKQDTYGMTFIDGSLRSFLWQHNFAIGAQPLADNLIRNMTEKTWAPLIGSSIAETIWATNQNYVPLAPQEETSHAICKIIRDSSLNIPYQIMDKAGMRGGSVIEFADPGPTCGITIQMNVALAQNDRTMANYFMLRVADYVPMHSVVSGIAQQDQQQTDANRKKAGQVISPF